MAWSTIVKLCLIAITSFTAFDYVTAQGNISFTSWQSEETGNVYWHTGRSGSSAGNIKLKEEVEFLKANLSALWDIVSVLQTRATEERQGESDELVVSLSLKKRETYGPNLKNSFDSQVSCFDFL